MYLVVIISVITYLLGSCIDEVIRNYRIKKLKEKLELRQAELDLLETEYQAIHNKWLELDKLLEDKAKQFEELQKIVKG